MRRYVALVPAYRSHAHSSIRTAKQRCGRPKRKGHYRTPGLSRGNPCILFVLLCLCTCHTLPLPALLQLSAPVAPCSTYQVALAPALRTSHSLHLHPAPCNPTPPTESRPHVPPVDTTQDPGMHLQVRSPARYRTTDTVRPLWILCRLDMGLVRPMPWTEPGRARPSPLRDNHDLPCPDLPFIGLCHCDSPVGPRTSRKHHGQPAIHPSIHPSTVHCDGHPPLRGAGHLDAGNQPTNCCPA